MAPTSTVDFDALRQDLLKAKLGELFTWSVPELLPTIGPSDPADFVRFEARRAELVHSCTDHLRALTDDQLLVIAKGPDDAAATRATWRSFQHDVINRLQEKIPPWYSGGFGHADHVAEFDYWAKMTRWTVEEVLCLSIGVEPRSIPREVILRLAAGDGLSARKPRSTVDYSHLSRPLQFLLRRYEQLNRRFDPEFNGWSVRPNEFIAWVERVEFEAHPEFLRLMKKYHSENGLVASPSTQAKEPDKREIDKIAQLFTAMAITKFGYDPEALKSPIPKEIVELAANIGISVSDDSVRKYLDIGAKFLPKEWKTNIR